MKLKVIYSGLQKENYNPQRGFSFEYNNFYLTLKNMPGIEVLEYPFDHILEVGQKRFNSELLDLVKKEKPDLLFAFMYTDELLPKTLSAIKKETKTITVAWCADDYWRFWNYSKHWPPYFHWVVTTYSKAVDWYRKAGHENVILSEWACNTSIYKPLNLKKDIDVGFVGQFKPPRGRIIDFLKKSGIKVKAFGFGWPNGKISQKEMLEVFSRSKISLNLSDRPSLLSPKVLARIFLKKSIDKIKIDLNLLDNLRAFSHFAIPHTHARPFELAGCRSFVISGISEDIKDYYQENREMVFYSSVVDLLEKIRYYLPQEKLREEISQAAYLRTIKENTYEKRFKEIFNRAGLLYE